MGSSGPTTRYRIGRLQGAYRLGDEVDVPDGWQVIGCEAHSDPAGYMLEVFALIPVASGSSSEDGDAS